MEFLFVIGIVVAAVWAVALMRYIFEWSLNYVMLAGLLTLIAGVVIGYDFYHTQLGPIPVTVDRLMLAVTVGLYLVLALFGYERIQAITKIDMLVFAFLGFTALSTFAHDWSYRDNLPLSRLLFFNLLPVAFYVAIRNARMKSHDLKLVSLALGGLGVYLAVTAVAETCGWDWLVYPGYILSEEFPEFLGRGRGPMLNPVSNGIFMTVSLCSLLMWWPHVGQRWRIVIALAVPIILAGIFSTLTRSVWLAAGVALLLFVWLPSSRVVKGVSLAAAATLALIVLPFFGDELSSFKRDKYVSEAEMQQSAQLRPLFAIVALRMLQDRPILGHGYGQYTQAKRPYLKDPTSKYPLFRTKPYMQHNVVLSYLTELGLIGTCLFLMLVGNLALISWRLWKRESADLWIRQFGLMTLVILGCHFINGMFHDVSIIPMENMLLFFFAGIATRLYFGVEGIVLAAAKTNAVDGIAGSKAA